MRPSRGYPFVYSTQHNPKGNPQAKTDQSASRKRKWSPGSTALYDNKGTGGSSSVKNYSTSGTAAKILKTKHDIDFDDDDFDMDVLGTAAMEQFELTQEVSQHSDQHQIATTTSTAATTGLQVGNPNPILSGGQRWTNPYQSHGIESAHSSNKQVSHRSTSPAVSTSAPTVKPDHISSETTVQSGSEKKAIETLQEENYAKDGEVKLLRNEKERLLGELRKREEQMHEIQTKLVSERKAVETQLSKEKNSLTAQLQFQSQELFSLREKCLLLEQRSNSPATTRPISSAKPIKTGGVSKDSFQTGKRKPSSSSSEFLSTESFIPLSQMNNTDVTPVQIKQKRDRPSGSADTKPAYVTKKLRTRDPRSPTTTPSGLSRDSNSSKLAAKSMESQTNSSPVTKPSSNSDGGGGGDLCTTVLNVPSRGLDDAQLLMLLVRRDLLKAPIFKSLDGVEPEDVSVVVSDKDSQTSEDESPQSTSDDNERRLTGLLSLLRVQPKATPPHLEFSNAVSTPVTTAKSSESSLSDSSLAQVSSPTGTPVRHKKLQLSKPHTLARTDIAKSRLQQVSGVGTIRTKSLSASNTPLRVGPDRKTSSLLYSVDKSGLEKSIGALLQSADMSSITRCGSTLSANSFSPSVLYSRMSRDSNVDLLKRIANIVMQYHADQLHKAKGSGVNTSLSEFGDSLDSSSTLSPKSSLSSSGTISSKTSSDIFAPLRCDQELASQAFEILETLVSYSQSVRDQILMQAPNFVIVSRPGSSLDMHPPLSGNSSLEGSLSKEKYTLKTTMKLDQESDLTEVSRKLSYLKGEEDIASVQNSPMVHKDLSLCSQQLSVHEIGWKGQQLCNLRHPHLTMSNKVWINKEHAPQRRRLQEVSFFIPSSDRPTREVGCVGLFQALLEMPAPPWRESTSNIVTCLKILTALAEDCPTDQLRRFSPLLEEDSIGICLDKDDPLIVLSVLGLLRHLVKSSAIVALLCCNREYCVPSSCYIYLLTPPTGNSKHPAHYLQFQIVRLISNVLVVENGPSVLLTSSCQCTHELLKTLVLLLNNLLENVNEISQWTHQELTLVREVISLMHTISIHDNYFDSHRLECEHTYMYVLNTLSWLLKTHSTPLNEVALVTDLLEYCEDLEDSEEQDKMDVEN